MSGDWTSGITPALMALRLTPQQAARVKYRALLFRLMDPNPRINDLMHHEAGHRWFCYCLDTVARAEG